MAAESTAVVFVTEIVAVPIFEATVSTAVVIATKTATVLILIATEPAAVTIVSGTAPVAKTVIVAMATESQIAKGVPIKKSFPIRIVGRNIDGRIMGVRKIIVSIRVIGIVGVTVVVGHATAT